MLAAQRHVHGREEPDADLVARPADLREHTICALSGMRAARRARFVRANGFSGLLAPSVFVASRKRRWSMTNLAGRDGRGLPAGDFSSVIRSWPSRTAHLFGSRTQR